MNLTDAEKAMYDGHAGPAKQKAMDLLMRYGEALGAERLVEVNNVAGAFDAFLFEAGVAEEGDLGALLFDDGAANGCEPQHGVVGRHDGVVELERHGAVELDDVGVAVLPGGGAAGVDEEVFGDRGVGNGLGERGGAGG